MVFVNCGLEAVWTPTLQKRASKSSTVGQVLAQAAASLGLGCSQHTQTFDDPTALLYLILTRPRAFMAAGRSPLFNLDSSKQPFSTSSP